MKIPLSYNLRNLVARKGTTLMTAIGIALTVAVLVVTLALVNGLRAVFAGTGHPNQALVLRTGVTSELNSNVSEQAFNEIRTMPGFASTPDGQPMVSAEVVSVVNLPSVDNPEGMNVTVRGLGPIGIAMRDEVKVVRGRPFTPGLREVIVGESVAKRYKTASRIGGKLTFGRGDWEIVGVMSGGRSAVNSEIWADLDQLQSDFERQGDVSAVLVRLPDASGLPDFAKRIADNQRLAAHALGEREYYERMTNTSNGQFLQIIGMFVAVIMAVGSGFGAMNTMYAAVARRTREIGTLRALGFSRRSILTSFLIESVLLALVGGVLGVLLALPMNNVTTGVGNWETFSEIAFNFRVTPTAIAVGLIFAVIIGAIGGLLPAGSAARKDPLVAMREP